MEDQPLFNWKNWSAFRKAQIVAGALGAFVTIAMNIPFTVDKYSLMASALFELGMTLMMPTLMIWKALGNPQEPLLFVAIEVIINSFLFVIAATLIGGIVREITKPLRRKRP